MPGGECLFAFVGTQLSTGREMAYKDNHPYAPDQPDHPAHDEFERWIVSMSDAEYEEWLAGITKLRKQEEAE
jgi:hypothetical protein